MSKSFREPPRPKRQHYVPRLHLNRFVGEQPKNMVWTFDNQTEKWRPSTVENTAVQSNFYSVPTKEGLDDGIEALLGKIESAAAAGYEMLLAGKIPTGQARADFAMFVATLHVRTPAMINAVAAGHAQALDRTLDVILSSRDGYEHLKEEIGKESVEKCTYEDLRAFTKDKSRYHLAVSRKQGLSIIGAADEIGPILYRREWFVCEPREGYFITSDHPVFRFVPPEESHSFYGDGGFLNRDAEVTFPLSPTRLLLIAGEASGPPLHSPIALARAQVNMLNEARALAAEQYVYSHTRNDEIGALAVFHKSHRERIEISGGHPPSVKVVRKAD